MNTYAAAASRLGLTPAEYRVLREAGEKWCTGCKTWHPLDEISEQDACRDGYANSSDYLTAFRKINWAGAADAHRYWTQLVWVVDFKLVKEAA